MRFTKDEITYVTSVVHTSNHKYSWGASAYIGCYKFIWRGYWRSVPLGQASS